MTFFQPALCLCKLNQKLFFDNKIPLDHVLRLIGQLGDWPGHSGIATGKLHLSEKVFLIAKLIGDTEDAY